MVAAARGACARVCVGRRSAPSVLVLQMIYKYSPLDCRRRAGRPRQGEARHLPAHAQRPDRAEGLVRRHQRARRRHQPAATRIGTPCEGTTKRGLFWTASSAKAGTRSLPHRALRHQEGQRRRARGRWRRGHARPRAGHRRVGALRRGRLRLRLPHPPPPPAPALALCNTTGTRVSATPDTLNAFGRVPAQHLRRGTLPATLISTATTTASLGNYRNDLPALNQRGERSQRQWGRAGRPR